MARMYALDGKLIADDFPTLRIGDKLYRIDVRKRTYDAVQKKLAEKTENSMSDEDIILEGMLGRDAYLEITSMDLTINGFKNLVICCQAAMLDISFEEAEKRFQGADQQSGNVG